MRKSTAVLLGLFGLVLAGGGAYLLSCPDFGTDGSIDLTHNMPFKQHGFYYSTSPPLVDAGKVIVAALTTTTTTSTHRRASFVHMMRAPAN